MEDGIDALDMVVHDGDVHIGEEVFVEEAPPGVGHCSRRRR